MQVSVGLDVALEWEMYWSRPISMFSRPSRRRAIISRFPPRFKLRSRLPRAEIAAAKQPSVLGERKSLNNRSDQCRLGDRVYQHRLRFGDLANVGFLRRNGIGRGQHA
jgi:hypothetical protein